MLEMYKGLVNSPETTITNNIGTNDTIIYVLDPARVPSDLPNLMVLGTGTNAETIKVTAIEGNALTVERGFQGIAKDWLAGTIIARNFTEYDYAALVDNINELELTKETPDGAQAKADTAEGNAKTYASDLIASHSADTAKHPISVDEFGAVGDGVSDDTQAIKDAINSIQNTGVLAFGAGKKYKVSNTIEVDVSKVKGIVGNNALLFTETDIIVLHVFGGLTTGTADPTSTNTQDEKFNMSPFVRDLKIYSTPELSVGTGIKIVGTFGLRIEGCHIFELDTGIRVTGKNRNIIIKGNHVWNCRTYCLHYDHADAHQSIINDNHMSYAKSIMFFENGDVHNIEIVGNNLEGGKPQDDNHDNVIRMVANQPNTQISQFQIVGNTIEEHTNGTSLIYMYREIFPNSELEEGEEQPTIVTWEIVGNELSGANEANIEMYSITMGVISGNVLRSPYYGYDIKVFNSIEGVNISGNVFTAGYGENRFGGALFIESVPNFVRPMTVGTLKFANNTITQKYLNPIVIKTHSEDTNNAEIFELTIENNTIQQASNRGDRPEADVDLEGFAVDIDIQGRIDSMFFNNNQLRCRSYNEHGIKIAATGSINNLIVKNNMIRGLVSRNGTPPTWYDLPDDTPVDIIIGDNIPV